MITQDLQLSQDGGRADSIGIQLQYSLPSNLRELTVNLPSVVGIDSASGFSYSGSEYHWDGRTANPWLTGRYNPTQTAAGGYQAVDKGNWAIISKPGGGISLSWQYQGQSPSLREQYSVNGTGVIANDGAIAYLGEYEEYKRWSANEKFRLIVPAVANPRHSTDEILDNVATASETLSIGPYTDEVLMIAAPAHLSNWGPSGTQFGDEGFWTLDQAQIPHPNNTWVHEYIHTRQDFYRDSSLRWLIEGTAQYYAAWAGVDQDYIDFDRFYGAISNTPDPGAVLANPRTWATEQTKYSKGVVVTTALAAEIHQRTNGGVQLGDVMHELATGSGTDRLTMNDFRSAVRAKGLNLSEWIDAYIEGRDLPSPPNDPTVYGLPAESPTSTSPISTDTEPESEPEEDEEEDGGEILADPEPELEEDEDEDDGEILTEPDPEPEEDEDDTDEVDEPTPDPPTEEEPETEPPVEPIHITGECPVCAADVDVDKEYCNACGTALQRECHVCGGQAPGQEYCPECGTQLIVRCDLCGHEQSATHPYCDSCGTDL